VASQQIAEGVSSAHQRGTDQLMLTQKRKGGFVRLYFVRVRSQKIPAHNCRVTLIDVNVITVSSDVTL